MVVNELKNPYKNNSFQKKNWSIFYINKNWNPSKNDYDMDLWKYGSFQAIQKSITFYD
jgi:hypothetical protein